MPREIVPVGKIVVALSGPMLNARVIHEAVRLSTLLDAQLYAVHMRLPKAGGPSMMMNRLPVYTEEDLREHFSARGYEELAETIPVRIFEGNNIAKLCKRITEGADLLIVGHTQRNRISALLTLQAVEMQIVDLVSCPVMVVPNTEGA